MNKSELSAKVAQKTRLKNTEATKAVDTILESVIQAVAKGEEVRLVGFGSFTAIKRDAHQGRNPRTGKTLNIPASTIPKFKPGKEFKEVVS